MKQRRRGVAEVDRYKDQKYGVDVAICLNKESGNFIAEYEGETLSEPTLEAIRAALFREIKNRVGLPIVTWITGTQDGVWMECTIWDSRDWEAEGVRPDHEFLGPSDRRINAHEFWLGRKENTFTLPFAAKASHHGDVHYLPYDESLWQALNAIGDKMGELLAQLQTLVGTAQGRKRLAAFAKRMLPSGKEAK